MTMNIFRILGDLSHALSKCILIFAIHVNRSAEGVSLITQALYAGIFCTRYIDLFLTNPADSKWNFIFKIFYILSSFYILLLMLRVYARTRETEKAWKLGAYCLGGALILAPLVNLILRGKGEHNPLQMLIDFSLILESVCILPQLLLLRQTTVPTVIDSFYLLALGSYRAFYILNWIEREIDDFWKPDPISVTCGIVQTALYLDFAWVYWTRQRVKLRSGGVVDADDLSRGWLISKILGRPSMNEDEEARPALDGDEDGETTPTPTPTPKRVSNWGKRGISVQADDSVLADEARRQREREREQHPVVDAPDARMKDPDELARVLDDDDDDDDEGEILPSRADADADADTKIHGIGGGEEWRK